MASAPLFWDPTDTAPLIDRMIGDEYEVVKRVGENVPGFLAALALIDLTSEQIIAFTSRLVELENLAGSLEGLDTSGITALINSEALSRAQGDAALELLIQALTTAVGLKADASLANVSNVTFAAKIVASGYTGGGAVSWADVTDKPAFATAAIKSISDFGTINGNDSFDNQPTFTTTEASPYARIYLPEGTFYTTTGLTDLKKAYYGPGKIRLTDGSVLPGKFTTITAALTPYTTTGITGFFRGDLSKVEPAYFRIEPGLRIGHSERYFEPGYIPKVTWFTPCGGWSGRSGRLQDPAAMNATAIKILGGVSGFVPGQTLKIYDFATPTLFDTITISPGGVDASTQIVSFTPPLSRAYAANSFVTHGNRTWHGNDYVHVRNSGGGDAYGHIVRLQQNYVPLDSQLHFFDTATVGQYGGDVVFTTPGTYATGWESQYIDQGNDVAVIGQVDSFVRSVDTGARSCVWVGTYLKSEGTAPCDAAHVVVGGWRIGLDFVRGDFSSNGQAAIQLKTAQRIYLNGSVTNAGRGGDPAGIYTPFFGNILGDTWIEHNTDVTGAYADIQVGATHRLRMRATGQCTWTGNLNLSNGLNVNAGNASFAGEVNMATTRFLYLNGANTAWLTHNADVTSPYVDLAVSATYRLRMRGTGVLSWNGQMNISNGLNVDDGNVSINKEITLGGKLTLNATGGTSGIALTGSLTATDHVTLAGKLFLNTAQTAWIEYNGSNVRVTKNSGSTFANLV